MGAASSSDNYLGPGGAFSMNKIEASKIITVELAKYREWSYDQLRAIVDAPKLTFEVVGTSGTRYYIDIVACWDATPEGDVRVIGCIDDGGWRAFIPMSDSFIKSPDGSFVGEESH
jgi:hypothetical protein